MSVNSKSTIIHANINGMRTLTAEKKAALQVAPIISIQDTRIKPHQSFLSDIFPNHYVYEIKHTNTAGMAVLIEMSVKHELITCVENENRHHLITILIKDRKISNKNFYFSSLYASPVNSQNPHFNLNLLKRALSYKCALVVGDFNARHKNLGCKGTNKYGRYLYNYLINTNHTILNDPACPTFFHVAHNFNDTLDYAISTISLLNNINNCYPLQDIGSDHLPLSVIFNNNNTRNAMTGDNYRSTQQPFNVKLTNWEVFQQELNTQTNIAFQPPTEINTPADIDNAINKITALCNDAIEKSSTPFKRVSDKLRLPPDILLLIRSRRHIRRKLAKTNNYALRKEINELNKAIKHELNVFKKQHYINQTEPLNKGPGHPRFWPTIKKLFKNRNAPLTPLITDVGAMTTPLEKANAFHDYFKEILTNSHHSQFDSHFKTQVDNQLPNLDPLDTTKNFTTNAVRNDPLLKPISLVEINTIISKLKNGKAPGPDGLRYEHIKHFPNNVICKIMLIFNAMIYTAYIPPCFKKTTIAVIPKVGKNLTSVTAYRPIALAPTLNKLFERVITNRLLKFTIENNILHPQQTAFLPNRDTTENTVHAAQTIINNFNSKKFTLIMSIDLKQAFDKIWHNGLLYTLLNILPLHFCRIIKSFLTNRNFNIKYLNTTASSSFIALNGVPQGSPLSPLLFNLFLSKAPFSNATYNYADDTFFLTDGETPTIAWEKCKPKVENFINWCNQYRLRVQETKTAATFFTRRHAVPRNMYPDMKVQNQDIMRATNIKILGVRLDIHMTLAKHMEEITSGMDIIINNIRKIMTQNKSIPSRIAVLLYKTLLRTKITYAAPILTLLSTSNWKHLRTFENKALRAALRTGIRTPLSILNQRAGISQIKDYYYETSHKTLNKLIHNKNKRLLSTIILNPPVSARAFTHSPLHRILNTFDPPDRLAKHQEILNILS